jgi:hypothetical protein
MTASARTFLLGEASVSEIRQEPSTSSCSPTWTTLLVGDVSPGA